MSRKAITPAEALRWLLQSIDYDKDPGVRRLKIVDAVTPNMLRICRESLAAAPAVLTGTD